MGKLARNLVVLVSLPLICSCIGQAIPSMFSGFNASALAVFLAGFIMYAIISAGIRNRGGRLSHNLGFFQVFRHEITHAATAFSAGGYIDEMQVMNPDLKSGPGAVGYVKHHNSLTGTFALIALAPYCFPIFTIPLLLLKFFPLRPILDHLVNFFIGFTLAFHYLSVIRELDPRQADIRDTGCFASLFLIPLFNILSLVIIKAALNNDWTIITNYVSESWSVARENYQIVWEMLKRIEWRPEG